ncbi:LuxR C-terminal-related transcriptional regulator [Burkholderia ubonensis]|uniref:LuxR C-terminal-related transcriptional regulator n=1 Tax=Burkholderia ubonensis TaxID=101571 RepID=UPI0018DF29FF|nr:LuxR C-terminal-related transcriptional regulator [Burkholderia ubonensis]
MPVRVARHRAPAAGYRSGMTLDLIVADDQPIFALGVERLVASHGIGCVTHRVSDCATLIAILHADACDVLVTNFMFEGDRQGGGLRTLGYVRRNFPALPIVVFTVAENHAIYREIWRLGVAALVSKADSPGELLLAIRSAASGQRYRSAMIRRCVESAPCLRGASHLSPREAEILLLFVTGLSAAEVAERLKRSVKTVSRHKRSGMEKLGVSTDYELFDYMRELGGGRVD